MRAVKNCDYDLAKRIINEDQQIDAMEIDIEEECLHTLACYQPVAQDLRFVVSVLKINSDLERIADRAANIAEQASFLAEEPRLAHPPYDMPTMAIQVCSMLKHSLDALLNQDTDLAQSVNDTNDEVDWIHRKMYGRVAVAMRANPDRIKQVIYFLTISKQLEQITDNTCNIAEDMLYKAKGTSSAISTQRSAMIRRDGDSNPRLGQELPQPGQIRRRIVNCRGCYICNGRCMVKPR